MSRLVAGMLVLVVTLSACKDVNNDVVTPPIVPSLAIVSGNQQSAAALATLPQLLVIAVTDQNGDPLADKTVTWTATLAAIPTPSVSTTGTDGRASTSLKLGAMGGTVTVRAAVSGADDVVFTITSTGPEALLTLIATVPVPIVGIYQHDAYIRDGIAFLGAWNSGILIYDVGNGVKGGTPSAPKPISSIVTNANGIPGSGSRDHNAWWFHNPVTQQNKYLFVGQEGSSIIGTYSSGDIHVVDVSNIDAPVEVGYLNIPGAGAHNFWMDEARQILYAGYYNGGVIAVDVSGTLSGNISNRIVANTKPGGANNTYVWGVHLARNLLYVSDMLTGIWALDPITLAIVGGGNNVPDRYTSELWVSRNVGYSGTWGTRTGNRGNVVKIWNLSGAGPLLADSFFVDPNIGTVGDVATTPDQKVLVVVGENGSGGGLFLYDMHDPFHPSLMTSTTVNGGFHTAKISVIGGRTYVFASKNIGNPASPALMIFDITGAVSASTAN